jgi:ferrochelatase
LDIFCPGFPADCLETLEEIAMEVQEDFIHAGGGKYNYIACLNDAPAWIDGLHRIATEHTGSWPLNSESPEALALSQERASELAACPVLHP